MKAGFSAEAQKTLGEYFLGHQIDSLGYNQIHNDGEYRREAYARALDWLDPEQMEVAGRSNEISQLRQEIEDLKSTLGLIHLREGWDTATTLEVVKKNPDLTRGPIFIDYYRNDIYIIDEPSVEPERGLSYKIDRTTYEVTILPEDVYNELFKLERKIDTIKMRFMIKLINYSDARRQMSQLKRKHDHLLSKLSSDEREAYLFKMRSHGMEIRR